MTGHRERIFEVSRVLACPKCGQALPPDTSLFSHKCGVK